MLDEVGDAASLCSNKYIRIFDKLFESRIFDTSKFLNMRSTSNIDGSKKSSFSLNPNIEMEPYSNIIRKSNISSLFENQIVLIEY